jgi:hypothetical protein
MMKIKSSAQDQIVPAMIAARKKITGAVKGKTNDFFRSTYVDLPSVIQCCNKELLENDLLVSQPTIIHDGKVYLVTEIMHVSGQWKRGYLPIINKKQDDQGQGAALTYTRRQGLLAILNIPALDDDGNATIADEDLPKGQQKKKPVSTKEDVPWESPPPRELPTVHETAAQVVKEVKEEGGEKTLTKAQQTDFIAHVKKKGVPIEGAVALLNHHGYKKSKEVPSNRLGFFKSEIDTLAQKEKTHA